MRKADAGSWTWQRVSNDVHFLSSSSTLHGTLRLKVAIVVIYGGFDGNGVLNGSVVQVQMCRLRASPPPVSSSFLLPSHQPGNPHVLLHVGMVAGMSSLSVCLGCQGVS